MTNIQTHDLSRVDVFPFFNFSLFLVSFNGAETVFILKIVFSVVFHCTILGYSFYLS